MIIKNFDTILSNTETDQEYHARKIILELLEVGINSVLPENLIPSLVKIENEKLIIEHLEFQLSKLRNLYVVGAGKASGTMATAIEPILEPYITDGFINIPEGTKNRYPTRKIKLNEATHPIPSEKGVYGAHKIIEMVSKANEHDIILFLLSGGASALLPLPAESISLDHFQLLNKLLIKSGATIQEINTVRKHCSQIKGGQLAKIAYPGKIVTLILSDVIGNPLESIASGPTVPDPTTFDGAIAILKKYKLWKKVNDSVRNHLKQGSMKKIPETPKPSDEVFKNTITIIIGDINLACEAIKQVAERNGFTSYIHSTNLTGEARDIGKEFFIKAKNYYYKLKSQDSRPIIFIAGGEPTVTVKGNGKGGRCQEMGLAIISEFQELSDLVFGAIGTDGIDGFTDIAGIIIDKQSANQMKMKQLDYKKFLNNNDSYNFFKEIYGSQIETGPTGTNVNDIILIGIF